mmetsp:Transcript_34008/g.82267  ORF Transcript_34008/g.82267 Transcript_34008/m.82267 type:complete len:323 (+) Transcript_34008:787-1755(+)
MPFSAPIASSSSCVPCSIRHPASRTSIVSALRAVLNLCAIIRVVRPLQTAAAVCGLSMLRWISFSVLVSNALVASSSRTNLGALITQRANPTLCLSPPDSFIPLSPTRVSSPSGSDFTNFSKAEILTASHISSSVASSLPYVMLSRSDAWNKTVSCATTPILDRRDCCSRDFTSMLSTSTDPSSGSYIRRINLTIVVFPLPLGPTRAAVFPAGMLKLTLCIPPTSTFSLVESSFSSFSFLESLIQKLPLPFPLHMPRPCPFHMPLWPNPPFPLRPLLIPSSMSGPPNFFLFALTLYLNDTLSKVMSPLGAVTAVVASLFGSS